MLIRNKPCIVYDIEVFVNVFHCTLYNTESEQLIKFECSIRKNEIHEMCQYFLNTDAYFVGYNNIHYDNPIINYCIDYFNYDKYSYKIICKSIYNLSKIITSNNDYDRDKWVTWKYANYFKTLDLLTMLYSQALRVSLKEMQVTMMYKNVQEFNCDWNKSLRKYQIDSMIEYNVNDVMSTTELLYRCKKDIELRIAIEDEYNVRVLSMDGVNIGMKILSQKYLEKANLSWRDIKDLRSPMNVVPLNDVILPFIKYDNPILQNVLSDMKNQIVSPGRKGYENKFIFEGLRYSVGVGGIHSVNDPEIVIPKEDEMLIDIDVDKSGIVTSLIAGTIVKLL